MRKANEMEGNETKRKEERLKYRNRKGKKKDEQILVNIGNIPFAQPNPLFSVIACKNHASL